MMTIGDAGRSSGDLHYRVGELGRLVDAILGARRLESASIGAGGMTVKGGAIVILDANGAETMRLSTDGLTLEGLLQVDGGDVLAIDEPLNRWVAVRDGNIEFGRVTPEGTDNFLARIRAAGQDLQLDTDANFFIGAGNELSLNSGSGTIFIDSGSSVLVEANGNVTAVADDDVLIQGINVSLLNTGGGGVFMPNLASEAGGTNVVSVGGEIHLASSTRRIKTDIKDFHVNPQTVLDLKPRMFRSKREVERDPDSTNWHVGLIAEEVDELGLTAFVDYDADGQPKAVTYDRLTVALLDLCRAQQAQLDALTAWAETQGFQPPAASNVEATVLPKRTRPVVTPSEQPPTPS